MLLFFAFVFGTESRKPLFLVPGILASKLQMSVTGESKHWFCPKGVNKSIFSSILNFVPPMLQCTMEYGGVRYNRANDSLVDEENVEITPYDFGGLSGIDYLIKLPFGLNFIPRFNDYIQILKKHGYVEGKDLFGVPNDWRLGVFQKDSFWMNFKNLIEKGVNENKEKAIIHAHSMGCMVVQRFLNDFVSDEWKEKYIDNVVYIGPSFAGATHSLSILIESKYHGMKFQGLTKFLQHLSSAYQLLPNLELNGDVPIILTPNRTYLISEIEEYFLTHKELDEEEKMILKKSIEISHRTQKENNVKTLIIYNSAIPTRFAVDMRTNKTVYIRKRGDGVVLSDGIEEICKKWKMEKKLECIDVHEVALSHNKLIMNPISINFIMKWSLNNDNKTQSQKYTEL